MSIHDLYNESITYQAGRCNSFVMLRKKIKDITKLIEQKEIVNIECELIVTFRSKN